MAPNNIFLLVCTPLYNLLTSDMGWIYSFSSNEWNIAEVMGYHYWYYRIKWFWLLFKHSFILSSGLFALEETSCHVERPMWQGIKVCMSESHVSGFPSLALSDEAGAPADSLSATSLKILNQKHPAKMYPDPDPKKWCYNKYLLFYAIAFWNIWYDMIL